jgi:hypothetical protein
MNFDHLPNKLTRRHFTLLSTLSLISVMATRANASIAIPGSLIQNLDVVSSLSMRRFGTTFSPLQCWYLGLDYREAFHQICQLGFKRIRLCGYWHEIQPTEQEFDFSTLDWQLEECDHYGIEVILTIGMKAPRYPEYHFPDWLKERYDTTQTSRPIDSNPGIAYHTLYLIDRIVRHTRSAPAIKYWQVENEPFARMDITHGRSLSPRFIQREVEVVRSLALPDQKILLTNAITLPHGQSSEDDRAFEASMKLADAIGFNVYTKVPQGATATYVEAQSLYWKKLAAWQTILHQHGKEGWIAEAQAEPWEANELVPVKNVDYPSSSPIQATNLVNNVRAVGFNSILLWGCEYWYWHLKQGREQWWVGMQDLMSSSV